MHRRTRATAIGAIAVLIWATLALLTDLSGEVPPLQLVAMAFGLATVPGVIAVARGGHSVAVLRAVPAGAWLIGVGGLFGYHFCYFIALRNAPAVEASLINYLWPLLIVLFSAALPAERLHRWHLIGAGMGLLGTIVLVTGGASGFTVERDALGGYAVALLCAVIWAGYSVLNRRYAAVPTEAVAGFCAVTAVLAAISHLALETTRWPEGWTWLAVGGLGLGPIGVAFYVWDIGTKHGDLRLLGTLAYLGPPLSTIVLIAFGRAEPTVALALACVLIVSGAFVATGCLSRRGPIARAPGEG